MSDLCLAIWERAALGPTKSAEFAASNGCIYCLSRQAGTLLNGEMGAVLNGHEAGSTFRAEHDESSAQLLLVALDPAPRHPDHRRLFNLPFELIGRLPLSPPPVWFPNLSLRDTFIIDELATWFANRGVATGNFVWCDKDVNEVIRVIWQKRLPITPDELVSYFAAHGLPQSLHHIFRDRVSVGIELLCWSHSRPAIKKRRLASFDDISKDPRAWFDKFILPGLSEAGT